MLVLAHGRRLIVPADTVRPSDKLRVKLFDRFKHYYTSIACWAGGSPAPLLHRHHALACPLRPPPASSAAPPPEPFATLRTHPIAVRRAPRHACARP